ncbi:hypothetical protein M569_11469, partial [Genlisea aurea]
SKSSSIRLGNGLLLLVGMIGSIISGWVRCVELGLTMLFLAASDCGRISAGFRSSLSHLNAIIFSVFLSIIELQRQ